MTIDAAEIARLRARAEKADGAFISISGWDVLAILAELEKALTTLVCGHHHSLEIRSVESDYRACELCEARAMQCDAETMESKYRTERDAARDELEKARERIEAMRQANAGMAAERDAALALLREAVKWLEIGPIKKHTADLRARIAKLLGDA